MPFNGFQSPNYTPVPDELFDQLLPILGYAEVKVLLYIIRRTFGFKKNADPIAYSQFLRGITKKDGTVIDRGCGIKNATNLKKALDGLLAKGIIVRVTGTTQAGDNATTIYALHFAEGVLPQQQYGSLDAAVQVMPQQQTQETENTKQLNKREYKDPEEAKNEKMRRENERKEWNLPIDNTD